jgi:histidinol-phosphate aminotransferase
MLPRILHSVSSCLGSLSALGKDESSQSSERSLHDDVTRGALAYVRASEPYQAGMTAAALSRETGIAEADVIKLASNENPWGMSPKAREAIIEASSGLACYPDEHALTAELAQHHQVRPEQVVLANGSDQLITTVARAFLGPGRSAVMSQYAYLDYLLATQTSGACAIEVPGRSYGYDLSAMLAAIRPDTSVVWLANPNNPTGSHIDPPDMFEFLKQVPRDVLVVLDQAYHDYLPPLLRSDPAKWLEHLPNLVVLRTFSKIHGLAGLRIGYRMASEDLASLLRSVRETFSCNTLALAAARAAIRDKAFVQDCRLRNNEGLNQLDDGLQALGLQTLPSYANFLTVPMPDAPEYSSAAALPRHHREAACAILHAGFSADLGRFARAKRAPARSAHRHPAAWTKAAKTANPGPVGSIGQPHPPRTPGVLPLTPTHHDGFDKPPRPGLHPRHQPLSTRQADHPALA